METARMEWIGLAFEQARQRHFLLAYPPTINRHLHPSPTTNLTTVIKPYHRHKDIRRHTTPIETRHLFQNDAKIQANTLVPLIG